MVIKGTKLVPLIIQLRLRYEVLYCGILSKKELESVITEFIINQEKFRVVGIVFNGIVDDFAVNVVHGVVALFDWSGERTAEQVGLDNLGKLIGSFSIF